MNDRLILAGFLTVLAATPAQAQKTVSQETSPSNTVTIIYITNEVPTTVITLPAITTNAPFTTTTVTGTNGASLLGAFGGQVGGKFSISGHTLTLPAPEVSSRKEYDWRRRLNFGMNQSKGNTETSRYALGLDAVKEEEFNLLRFNAKGMFGENAGIKDTENAYAGSRYERLLTKKVYALGNLDWITDTIADLRYRITAIVSPGFRLIHAANVLVNLETGAGYIEERKDSATAGYAAGRAAVTAERVINAHVLVWCAGEYFPKLTDAGVFYVNTEAGIASYITRDLSLNVTYQERYDSVPVEGKDHTDSILSTSLSLIF